MIIKNNFNSKNTNPLTDYNNIGKGSHSLDKELDMERNGFIRDNMNNPILRDLRDENNQNINMDVEDNIDKSESDWNFFQ